MSLGESCLKILLERELTCRLADQPYRRVGKECVYVGVALRLQLTENLGIDEPHLVLALHNDAQDDLYRALTASALMRGCSPEWLCNRFTGMRRFDALAAGGHISAAGSLADVLAWFPQRPFELWRALRCLNSTVSVAIRDVMHLIPPAYVCDLVQAQKAFEPLEAEEIFALLKERIDVAYLARLCARCYAFSSALSVQTIDSARFGTRVLYDILKRRRGGLSAIPRKDLVRLFGGSPHFLFRALETTGQIVGMPLADVAEAFAGSPGILLTVLMDRGTLSDFSLSELSNLFGYGYYMLKALQHSGRLRDCSSAWLSEHLSADYLYEALSEGGHLAMRLCSPTWLADNLPVADLSDAVFESGFAESCSCDWIAANLPSESVLEALLHCKCRVTADWIVRNVPRTGDGDQFDALLNHCDNFPDEKWVVSNLEGMDMYLALKHLGHVVPGAMPLRELAHLVDGKDLLPILRLEKRLSNSEVVVDELMELLSEDELFDVFMDEGLCPANPHKLADVISDSSRLADVLMYHDLADHVSLGWLCSHLQGHALIKVLASSEHISDVEMLEDMFSGKLILAALTQLDFMGDVSASWLIRAFGHDADLLECALGHAEYLSLSAAPEELCALEDVAPDRLARMISRTSAFKHGCVDQEMLVDRGIHDYLMGVPTPTTPAQGRLDYAAQIGGD